MDKDTIKIAAYIGGGLALGGTLGVLVTRDHYKTKFRDELEDQIESVKDAFQREQKEGIYSDPVALADAIIPTEDREAVEAETQAQTSINHYTALVRDQGYVMVEGERYDNGGDDVAEDPDHEEASNEQQVTSIFDPNQLPERVPGKPYVVTVNEYMEETEFQKVSLVYYDEDGVLADDRDSIVPDILGVIGDGTSYFGVGSNDPIIVYVKNEKLGTIFEVVKDEQSFQKLVLRMNEPQQRPIRRRMPREE